MSLTPYDTSATKGFLISDLVGELKQLLISGDLPKSPIGKRENIYFVDNNQKHLQGFSHPIILEHRDHRVAVVDGRAITSVDSKSGRLKVNKEVIFADLRAALQLAIWEEKKSSLMSLGDLQTRMFSAVMAENLTRRMELDAPTTKYIQIVTAWMWYCLHYDADEVNTPSEKVRAYRHIGYSCGIDVPSVQSTLDDIPHLTDVDNFCTILSTSGRSVRLEKLTSGLLYAMLGGMWSPNGTEIMGVALEHPPTFAAVLYMTAIDKSYNWTILNKVMQFQDRSKELANDFVRNVERVRSSEI